MLYAQILINSILLGGIYACIAVGFSLVWGVMNILNVLHGTFLMLGGYVTFWMFKLYGVDPFLSLPVSAAVMFCAGYVVQRGLINKIVRAPMFMSLILTFGLQLIVVRLAIFFFTGDYRSVQPSYAGFSITVMGLSIPFVRISIFVLGVILTSILFWFMGAYTHGSGHTRDEDGFGFRPVDGRRHRKNIRHHIWNRRGRRRHGGFPCERGFRHLAGE